MKAACCRATLIEVRQHILWVAQRVEKSFPDDTTKTAFEKLAATLEASICFDPKTDDPIKGLELASDAIDDRCSACGGLGKVMKS